MSEYKTILQQLFGFSKSEDAERSYAFGKFGSVEGIVKTTKGDRVIWAIVIILTIASLLLIYSSTDSLAYRNSKSNESYLFNQLTFIVSGLVLIYIMHKLNYTLFSKIAKLLFIVSIVLLIYTLFFGVELNGGARWIQLPVINQTMQTSDLAKLSLFMYLSRLLSKRQSVIKDFKKGFIPLILPVLLICGLVAPANLSTAVLIGGTSFLLLFIGRVNAKHLFLTFMLGVLALSMLVFLATSYYDEEAGESKKLPEIFNAGRIPTWVGRIQTFYYGSKGEDNEKLYQINQAKIAIANGGWVGKGPGNSHARNFLPHSYSDFIYAIIIEEYGLIGGALMICIYLLFLYRCIRIYRKCPFAFGAFLALALSFMLVIQAMANMAVNVNLFPNTGVTLPLVSKGGSSFLLTCISIGIILSVARNVEQQEGENISKPVIES